MATWNLEDGLKLVRAIQQDCRKYGYHVTLGGGVLNDGVGRKDLDLYFLPMGNTVTKAEPKKLLQWLTSMWGPSKSIANYASEQASIPTPIPFSDGSAPSIPPTTIAFSSTALGSSTVDWYSNYTLGALITALPAIPEPSIGTIYRYKEKFFRSTSKDRIDVFIL